MKRIHAALIALLATMLPTLAQAQASAPPLAGASAPPLTRSPLPRLLTPAEKRAAADAATAPDLRPERPVVPQLSVPLVRRPFAPGASASGPRRGRAAAPPPSRIDDAAARCESLPGDQERATCLKQVAPSKPPN
jgi:hypothetical protein